MAHIALEQIKRACLKCGKMIWTTTHNRLCRHCVKLNAKVDDFNSERRYRPDRVYSNFGVWGKVKND